MRFGQILAAFISSRRRIKKLERRMDNQEDIVAERIQQNKSTIEFMQATNRRFDRMDRMADRK